MTRLKIAFGKANHSLLTSQQYDEQRFDASINLVMGDLVMYEIPSQKKGQTDKFQPKRRGLYQILSKLSDQSYFIRIPNQIRGGEKVSARRLILNPLTDTPIN